MLCHCTKRKRERGRSRGAREMRFREGGGHTDRETERDSCRNNISLCHRVSVWPVVVSGRLGKYICRAYKRFMNTKECHRRSRCTRLARHGSRETDVDDHREKWRGWCLAGPWTLPLSISNTAVQKHWARQLTDGASQWQRHNFTLLFYVWKEHNSLTG